MNRIVLIGSGNTATIFGRLIKSRGYEIVQVVSRTRENALVLARELNTTCEILTAPSFADADLYIVALHDQVLGGLDRFTALQGKFVVHTAGSVSIKVLEKISGRYGVLYPLQTLSKFVDHLPEIPLLVDGNNEETLNTIFQFAGTLSPIVSKTDDKQRMGYQIAAVFSANFSNHMYALAEIFCQRENLEFKQMLPLINEICSKVNRYSPYLTQTGPAMRNDAFTMSKHLESLSPYPDLKYIYLKLTESIINTHGKR